MRYVMMENKMGAEVIIDGEYETDLQLGNHIALNQYTCPGSHEVYLITAKYLVTDPKGIDSDYVFCYVKSVNNEIPCFI